MKICAYLPRISNFGYNARSVPVILEHSDFYPSVFTPIHILFKMLQKFFEKKRFFDTNTLLSTLCFFVYHYILYSYYCRTLHDFLSPAQQQLLAPQIGKQRSYSNYLQNCLSNLCCFLQLRRIHGYKYDVRCRHSIEHKISIYGKTNFGIKFSIRCSFRDFTSMLLFVFLAYENFYGDLHFTFLEIYIFGKTSLCAFLHKTKYFYYRNK